MYSPKVVEERIADAKRRAAFPLTPRPVSDVDSFCENIKRKLDEGGNLVQQLSKGELEFISSERVIAKCDFRYWAERYGKIIRDGVEGGGTGHIRFWTSQVMALEQIGKIEEKSWEANKRGDPVDGVCIAFHKARQLGATMLARLINCHRVTNWPDQRAMGASIDDDKIMELYDRDKLIIDSLPFYLKPSLGFDVKAEHIYFDKLNSRILYQQSSQKSGLGQGRQFELGHLTECASWPYPKMIEFDFFPTLPQSVFTLCILESTANGRGNWWHEFTEQVRKGLYRRWHYIFVPWYVEAKKYRALPPEGWKPSEMTMNHAKKVYESSREFVGKDILLPREQLYWYEQEREAALRAGSLNLFLSNYCATPEESFQHTVASQFSVDVLERIRLASRTPTFYEFERRTA